MSLTSISFVAFFFITLLVYYILPFKTKKIWLLLASYYFYMCAGKKYLCLIIVISFLTFLYGHLIEMTRNKKDRVRKMIMTVIIITTLMPLLFFKYLDFFAGSFVNGLTYLNIDLSYQKLNLIMPLGISFFILQAIGYLIDVYRGKIKPEKKLINYALFLAFFGYILSGPIERANNILPQLRKKKKFDYDMFCHGLQLMLYGFFIKLIVAERFAIVANKVFDNYTYYAGFEMLLGTIAYSLQLYLDFAGYSFIAQGMSQALGLSVMNNFEQPYFSKSIGEFWRRWHISLSSWFRDYIYIPLGGNRKGTFRKYINVIIVFAVSGLWHGANWNYMIWGLLHGIYQVVGALLRPLKDKSITVLKIKTEVFSYKLFQILINFCLVNIAWIFFRVSRVSDGINIISRIIGGWNLAQSFGVKTAPEQSWRVVTGLNLTSMVDFPWLHLGLECMDIIILMIGLLIILVIDVLRYKKIRCRDWLDKQNVAFRWITYFVVIFIILTFGIYGTGYNSSGFIYTNF